MRSLRSVTRQRRASHAAGFLHWPKLDRQSDCAAFAGFWMANLELLQQTDPSTLYALVARQAQVSALSQWMRCVINDSKGCKGPDAKYLSVEEGLQLIQQDVAVHGVLYVETLLYGKALIYDKRFLARVTTNEATGTFVRYGLTVAIPSYLHSEFMHKIFPEETLTTISDSNILRCICGTRAVSQPSLVDDDAKEDNFRCTNCGEKLHRKRTVTGKHPSFS
jgi:hypothetical protein